MGQMVESRVSPKVGVAKLLSLMRGMPSHPSNSHSEVEMLLQEQGLKHQKGAG